MNIFRLQRARNGRLGSHGRNFHILAKAQPNRLPDRGYFAEADPNAPVRPALDGVEKVDPRKRGGRYTSDFIWNTNWSEQMDYEEAMAREAEERKNKPAERESGFLNLNRAMDLNDMSVDLSAKLKPRERPAAKEEASTSNGAATVARDMEAEKAQPKERRRRRKSAGPGVYAARPPTAGEARKWERRGRYSRGSAVVPADPSTLDPEQQAAIAEEREAYERLKSRYQLWTLATAGTSFAVAYFFYTKDVAFSYLAGAAAGFLYLRMLSRSVEGVGVGAAVSQPRLLIPIVLALGYNRWNELQAGTVGIHAELLPMLTGFFTYKVSVVFCQGFDLLRDLNMPAPSQSSPAEPAPDAGDGVAVGDSGLAGSFDAASVDRAFAKRILTG